jgi:hypothetical protein
MGVSGGLLQRNIRETIPAETKRHHRNPYLDLPFSHPTLRYF